MSVRWNLYGEMRRHPEVNDERMQKPAAKNQAFQSKEIAVAFFILLVIWVVSNDYDRPFNYAFWFLLFVWWFGLSSTASQWYYGTALLESLPEKRWPVAGQLLLCLRVTMMDIFLPFLTTYALFYLFNRLRLGFLCATAVTAGAYLLRIWCYDQYRRRTLSEEAYLSLAPEERRENHRAQLALAVFTLAALLLGALPPETALPGGWRLERLHVVQEAVSGFQNAEAVVFSYQDRDVRAIRYRLPEEELTVYLDGAGRRQEAWLMTAQACYHYDGSLWQTANAADVRQPVKESVLTPTREELGAMIGIFGNKNSCTVRFTQEALRAQLLQLDVRLMDSYREVEASYILSNYSDALSDYRYRAYGVKGNFAMAEDYTLSRISLNPSEVASQLAQQKRDLGWTEEEWP